MLDYLIVGSGFFGAICARHLHDKGYRVAVVEKRKHIGGNCYTEEKDGINVHTYGPHIFHTDNKEVWNWINRYADFHPLRLQVMANCKGEIYSLPFSMHTFSKIYGANTPHEAAMAIAWDSKDVGEDVNLETSAIQKVGRTTYEMLIKGYTEKQWMREASSLPASIVNRLPVRLTYDNNYFNHPYQGVPIGGYTRIFEKLLDGIEVITGVDYFHDEIPDHKNVIYTGPIDQFFDYRFGPLEYKSVRHEEFRYGSGNVQGCPVMNYTDKEVPYTRTIEHKHFEGSKSDVSWLSFEYPVVYEPGKVDPYYPVNDEKNNLLYQKYKQLADQTPNVIFGGRLAEYKYYDMDQVIASALKLCKERLP